MMFCADCGKALAWVRLADDMWVPVAVSQGHLVRKPDGSFTNATIAARHPCWPEGEVVHDLEERFRAEAGANTCPKCMALPGEPCVNLNDRTRTTRWPHQERHVPDTVPAEWAAGS